MGRYASTSSSREANQLEQGRVRELLDDAEAPCRMLLGCDTATERSYINIYSKQPYHNLKHTHTHINNHKHTQFNHTLSCSLVCLLENTFAEVFSIGSSSPLFPYPCPYFISNTYIFPAPASLDRTSSLTNLTHCGPTAHKAANLPLMLSSCGQT